MISLSGILFLVGCHELLNIFWMIRYAVFAQESATIFGDEYIVLNSDTTEIFIDLNLVEVEEFCTVTGCLPVVDEGRDEVNSRLVGYHETFRQPLADQGRKPSCRRRPIRRQLVPNCSRLGRTSSSKPTLIWSRFSMS